MHPNDTKSTPAVLSMAAVCRLLLIEDQDDDASLIKQVLRREMLAVDLHQVQTIAEARMLLSEVTFDAVLVDYELPDGDCFDVLSGLLDAAILVPVVVLTPYGHQDAALAAMKAGASDCIHKELDNRHLKGLPMRISEAMQRHRMVRQAAERSRRRDQVRLIDTLRATVASVKHEINNPLAIISGNAQLLLELARMMDLDEDIVKPIRDIDEASLRITDSLDKLNSIKDLVNREHMNGDGHRNGTHYG